MPKSRRSKPLYQRGEYKLYPRGGRAHEIVWYDEHRKRERSISAGTMDEGEARTALDNEYTKRHGGVPHCLTCGQAINQRGEPVTVLLANYIGTRAKGDAMHPRLDHVLDYMEASGQVEVRCDALNERWVGNFRKWMMARTDRRRAPGTVENSVIALAAALRFGGVSPSFAPIPTTEVNRTPLYRADVPMLAAMFRYCIAPDSPTPAMRDRHIRERANLLRYLRAAVATWARPDAVHDIDTRPARRQWIRNARVLALNPDGRRQTRKFRATVPIARQFAPHLDATTGAYVTVASVKSAWEAMAAKLGLPVDGESGMKLIRRSVAQLARGIIGEAQWVQGQIMLGHRRASTSDVYALPDPAHIGLALAATESIIDQVEALTPGSYRDLTATPDIAISIERVKNA